MNNQSPKDSLLDLPISIFRDAYQTIPEGETTLRRIVSTGYYRSAIEAIRSEPDEQRQKEAKKQLRAFAIALLHHRKKGVAVSEQVKQQWPLLMVDVDQKDNPRVNMSELKKHLCRLSYVLLCAYSVRGGLWLVVRLPDNPTPDSLAAHFRYIQWLFKERFGIMLDASKGSNPTALRYVSYDAKPYFNEAATTMLGQCTLVLKKARIHSHHSQTNWQYGQSGNLLANLVRSVENAVEGNRHEKLLNVAIVAGGYAATGELDEQTAVDALENVACNWPDFNKSRNTIRDGIRYGRTKPLYNDTSTNLPGMRGAVKIAPIHSMKYDSIQPEPTTNGPKPTSAPVDPIARNVTVSDTELVQPFVHLVFQLPEWIDYLWTQFAQPPLPWNKIATHKALTGCLEVLQEDKAPVTSFTAQLANPSAILKPDELQLERLTINTCDAYPSEWDTPNPPDAESTIKPIIFHEWQQQHPYFSQMGLSSIGHK